MFCKLLNSAILVATVIARVTASPISVVPHGGISFNGWGGISSLNGFDNFYGVNNFVGVVSTQTVVQEKEVVCHSESIEIIQQRLLVLQEMAKRIITEQVCEVETQTVVFEQFHASLGLFSDDLLRRSGRHIGFDSGITSHFNDFFESDGSLSTHNLGFTGHDLGAATVVVGGSNWVETTSPVSVFFAHNLAVNAGIRAGVVDF